MEKNMENEMEAGIIMGNLRVILGLYGIMEKKMETTDYIGNNGNYYSILSLYMG